MPSQPQRLINSYIAISSTGQIQSAHDVPMDPADIDYRLKCTLTREPVITRDRILDCNGRFLDSKPKLTQAYRFTWTFATIKPQLLTLLYAYFAGASAAPTGTVNNEVQTLARTGTVSGGTFTIALTVDGRSGITATIPFGATAAQIQAALTKKTSTIGKIIHAGDVVVTGDWTAGMVLTFGGRLAHTDLPLVTIDNTLITGSGSITRTQTTAGGNKYHALTNSTSDAKTEFSFCLGYTTGSLPHEEYFNAIVERFEPSMPRNGDVGLVVSVLCNYEPDILDSYSVPACENFVALKTADCRVEIGGVWRTLDISSQTTTLNDSVPVDADAFGFDGVDPEQFERGDVPAYAINGNVFGAPNDTTDALAVAVKAESTVEYITHFGNPGNRFTLIAPQTILNPSSNDRQYAGTRNRSVISFDGEPSRDGVNTPVRAEAYLDQTTAFLLT